MPESTWARPTALILSKARLNVSLPGVARKLAQALVDEAHQTGPYSKATRGNIDIEINLT